MGVHLAIGELARPGWVGGRHPLRADATPARPGREAAMSVSSMRGTRDPLSADMARIVQLAIELTDGNGRPATGTRDALRSSISRHLNAPPGPVEVGQRLDPLHAFMTRPMWLVSRAVGVLLVCSMGAGSMFATADALPGDPLHDVKVATEQLRVTLARSPENRIAVEVSIAGARLREAVALEAKGREASAQAAISAYGEHIAIAAATVEELAPTGSTAALDRFRTQVVDQQRSIPQATAVALVAPGSPAGVQSASAAVAAAATGQDASADQIASSAAAVSTNAAASVAAPTGDVPAPPVSAPTVEPIDLPTPSAPTPSAPTTSAPTTSAPPTPAPADVAVTSPTPAPAASSPTVVAVTVPAATAPIATAPIATAPATTPAVTAPTTPTAIPASATAPSAAPTTVQTSAPTPAPRVAAPTATPAAVVDQSTKADAKAAEESAKHAQEAAKRAQDAAAKNAKAAKDGKKK